MTESEPSPERPALRIGNAEREESAQALAEHFSHGRLDGSEYEDRVTAVWAARTSADLAPLFEDLPEPRPAVLRPPNQDARSFGPSTAYGPPAGLGQQATSAYPAPYAQPGQTYGAPGLPAPGARPLYAPMSPHAPMSPRDPNAPAPFGREPGTGAPYSDKSKVAAGVLQLFLGGLGIGRFYTGHAGIAVAQLLVTLFTFGIGAVWGFVDGIVILAGRPTDMHGRPLRP